MKYQVGTAFFALIWLTSINTPAHAQFQADEAVGGPQLTNPVTTKLKCGVRITASGGPCKGIVASVPVPDDWPEQQVRIADESISPLVKRVYYRHLGGGVKQMLVEIPMLPAGQTADALITFEVTKHSLLPPESTADLQVPKKLPKDLLIHTGPSPYIESRNGKIISLAREVAGEHEAAWEKVEAIYDWVRDHVKYEDMELKGALRALNDKTGDCEELSSLFIAMCRAQKIPARTVWVPGHCYPEFYLTDSEGKGFWFPCQAAGARAFGGIPEERPVLQKGDNFRDPDRPKEKLRYVSEYLTGKGGGGRPKVKFVQEVVATP